MDGDFPPRGRESIFRPVEGISSPTRQLPANIVAEQSFLGALLSNNKVLDRASFLEPAHFSEPIHGIIFTEARRLITERRVADPVTLKTVLENTGVLQEVGGIGYLTNLISCMVGIINASDYAQVVRDTWLRRELIDIGETIVNSAFSPEPGDSGMALAMQAVTMLDGIAVGGSVKDNNTSLDAAVDAALEAMRKAQLHGKPAGISTGFKGLDARLGGLEPGLVYTIAGRPGSGKSSLGHQFSLSAAKRGIGVLELSLEMSATQLGRRALSIESGVPLFVMKGGTPTEEEVIRLQDARSALRGLPLTIDDAGGQTPRQIAAKCRAAKRKPGGLGLIMLDHLNLTRADDNDAKHGPTFAIERAAGMMLQIAKDCEVPVIMLTQLNRGVEGREDKRPTLSDLRQSGSIEENSYAVGFLYREEYYLQNTPEPKDGEPDLSFIQRTRAWVDKRNRVAGKADCIWGKVRDGETGTDALRFDGKTTSFSEGFI